MDTKKSRIYNVVILDESGSMSSIYDQALTGVNEVINGIRANQRNHPEQSHFVTIVTFEGNGMEGVKVRRNVVPIDKVEDFTRNDYVPGGCTPLYDAMGRTFTQLECLTEDDDSVFATVITDGFENSSTEYSGTAVKNLVGRLRKKGWVFAYIGANQDSVEAARELNIQNALNFEATTEGMAEMSYKYRKASMRFSNLASKSICKDDVAFSTLFDDKTKKEEK